MRIGELARRTGVTPELLRAWEQRYGLLLPTRTAGGFRLYSDEDEQRIRSMKVLIESGLSTAEAARQTLLEARTTDERIPVVPEIVAGLIESLDAFDATGAQAALDRAFATITTASLFSDVLLPYLRELGARWERGEASVAQEHFASNLIRGRLMGLTRDWAEGAGPPYLLACVPGEEHDLALIMFGITLAAGGGRVVFLGADTPVETLQESAQALSPRAIVLAGARREVFRAVRPQMRQLKERQNVWISGGGADAREAQAIGSQLLEGDPVVAAHSLIGATAGPRF